MRTFKHEQSFVFNTDEVGSPRESKMADFKTSFMFSVDESCSPEEVSKRFTGLIGALRVRGNQYVEGVQDMLLSVAWYSDGAKCYWLPEAEDSLLHAVSSFLGENTSHFRATDFEHADI